MTYKIFKNELVRNKIINGTLFLFILMGALLISIAIQIMAVLSEGVESFIERTEAPHFVQMHSGNINIERVNQYNKTIKTNYSFQIIEMIGIDGSGIYFNNEVESEAKSVMDIAFVKQAEKFDFLLDMDNNRASILDNEIGVPMYYKNKKNLKIGDTLIIKTGEINRIFRISEFIRDVQMNPSLVSSKRFLVSDSDFHLLGEKLSDREYLLEYRFDDTDISNAFENDYANSSMPKTGPAISFNLIRTLNFITDGAVILVLIVISLLLVFIALLCLRFIVIEAIEEDSKEVGEMKAIGISIAKIKQLYLGKYSLLAFFSCLTGYMLSPFISRIFMKNIAENIGSVANSSSGLFEAGAGILLVFLTVVCGCYVILNRLKKISVIDILMERETRSKKIISLKYKLSSVKSMKTEIFMGFNSVFRNISSYLILLIIFIICTLIITIPLNIINTMESDKFVNYMGIGKSDIRIDVRNTGDVEKKISAITEKVKNDRSVKVFSVLKTYRYKCLNSDGEFENISLETGDFTKFPIEYIEGSSPENKDEIALSLLSAQTLNKKSGDSITVENDFSKHIFRISGIYQDITNGGKTAKALIDKPQEGLALWYVININLHDNNSLYQKLDEYRNSFYGIKVTDMDEYINQSLGSTIRQLKLVAGFGIITSLIILSLLTALFIKMILAREEVDIAVLKCLGFNNWHIKKQYMLRIMFVLSVSIITGTAMSVIFCEKIMGTVGSIFGASKITLIIAPQLSFLFTPLLISSVVIITIFISVSGISKLRTGDYL